MCSSIKRKKSEQTEEMMRPRSIQAIISLQLYYRDSLLTSVPASIITCSSLQCTHSLFFTQQCNHITVLKAFQWFFILFRVQSEVLTSVQDSPSYRPWYHYDLIFCGSPSCLFCFSHTGLLHIPKTWQACIFFWVFVLVVSSTCSAHTPDTHTA